MKISELEVLKIVRRPFKDKKGVERPGVGIRCMDSAADSPFGTFVDVAIDAETEKKYAAALAKPGEKFLTVKASRIMFPYPGAPMTILGTVMEVK
jgi:hypothetical protein